MEYWFRASECQIWWRNTELFFWEVETNFGTFQKLSSYIGVSCKVGLESVKTLNRIFWTIEYYFRVLEYQILSTNTK